MANIKDTIVYIKGHLYERISSPFSFTLIFVLIYYYWPLVIFTLDSKLDSKSKIEYMQEYILKVSKDARIFDCLDAWPMSIYIISIAIFIMLIYAALFLIGLLIKELEVILSKVIKKWFTSAYIDSKQYAETIQEFEDRFEEMYKIIDNKTRDIQNLRKIARLTNEEKEVFDYVYEKGVAVSNDEAEEKIETYTSLRDKGIFIQLENSYKINAKYNILK